MTQQTTTSPEFYAKLHETLNRYFDDEELHTLCFDIGIDYDDLKGEGKAAKARELIAYLSRRNRLADLMHRCAELRPDGWASSFRTPAVVEASSFSSPVGKLCERITNAPPVQKDLTNWKLLEQVVIRAVVTGGVAAMTYYRQALPRLFELIEEGKEKNPSTQADLEATARILETINSVLPIVVRPSKLDCMLSYLGEETKFIKWFQEHIAEDIPERVLPAQAFFSNFCEHNRLRVIVDGIDGTGSFMRGIPLFCSAAAILVEDEPRVSAIYDPVHHVVYSAVLFGPHGRPEENAEAWAWQVATGNRVDLVELAQARARELEKDSAKQALGIHLTRTNPKKLHEFLTASPELPQSKLERLARASGAIYSLNSGIVAMADVATGGLGGFVNNITNLWDIAAGEVLVRACGGKVTTFDGAPIMYSAAQQSSVVASHQSLHLRLLEILNEC